MAPERFGLNDGGGIPLERAQACTYASLAQGPGHFIKIRQ
jgi:hypothetical protein